VVSIPRRKPDSTPKLAKVMVNAPAKSFADETGLVELLH
jgi:hypothetical protein